MSRKTDAMTCPSCRLENESDSRYCRQCAALLPAGLATEAGEAATLVAFPKDHVQGQTFAGRFRVIEEIGTGSMGAVYKVIDEKIEDIVSLKLLKPGLTSDPNIVELFQNEVRLARRISHKNICRVYDFGEDRGQYYLTMEYIPGEDLKSMIRMTKQLSLRTAVGIARQICEGLVEAHRLGIIHRDLKPGNIRIDDKGSVHIVDFGIAYPSGSAGKGRGGGLFGTAEYASPEQVDGKKVDARSDLYSLGIILYEMVTGEIPFHGSTFTSLAIKHLQEKPRSPRELAPHIPRNIERLILKCLEKDPSLRFQSSAELLEELSRIENESMTTEIRPNPARVLLSRAYRVIPKKRWLLGVAVALLGVLIGVSIATTPKRKAAAASGKKMLAVLPFQNLGLPEDEYASDGITEEITSRLSNLPELGVISRTSSMAYKKSNKTIPQIGRELGVDYILEGSVRWDQRSGRKGPMRVTPQLIRVADDTHIWTDAYDIAAKDIFALQSEVAEQVARKLEINLIEPDRKALSTPPTQDEKAYDAYLLGRKIESQAWGGWKLQELQSAIAMYDKAIKLDPQFALAYAQLSTVHSRLYFYGLDRSDKRLAEARACADRALVLQPDLPDAKMALAIYYYWGFLDYDRAIELLEEVRKSRPNVPLELLGYIWRRQGQWEKSTETLEEAFTINPRYTQLAYEIGLSYMAMRRYNQAEEWFNRALAINPKHLTSQLQKAAIAILFEGDAAKARQILKTAPDNILTDRMWLTVGLAERNYRDVLARLASLSDEPREEQHFYFQKDLASASVHSIMGDRSASMRSAEKSRARLEQAVKGKPDDPRLHAALGLTYAYLGRRNEAVDEGNRAAHLYPVSMDAAQGSIYVLNLARIYAILGDNDKSIEFLRYLLSIPMCEYLWDVVSVQSLKMDPSWDSLRADKGFQDLRERNLF